MSLRLPPLPALRLFEAAGRLRSFKLAAAELGLTPSAVSHGIAGLEETLGAKLFVRGPRGLSLTAAGGDYLAYIGEALSLIAVGTQRLPSRRGERAIAVSCAPTFAARWLLPRLHRFTARWPKVGITVDTSRRHVGFPVDGFDFAIRMSRTPSRGLSWVKLLREEFVPVCSPAYRAKIVGSRGTVDLARAALIHVTTASEGWQNWLEARGLEDIDCKGGLRFDTVDLALGAAVAGLGVAIGRRPWVDRELASGELIELADKGVAAETAYWLVSASEAEGRPELRGFKRWLIAEAGKPG
ncbi:DNA-binding transcriptional regulator, LysR family [Enhydrobacter aerosaccus]|uniref:DNA-binding transcriptional regulator, LysR family n=1 Tax=Enhydrobacter aerosaccus TaxID=225324 RepID=A0A1T4SYI9_9HYPH|nr:LysR substrate-binding domain-containing protein [Enhydrobacter aerosaccus]SKA33316.1 DNA-binding transcriptional regulator, LysR family [Enhydrobacter aerosaccus]